jgi:hypothetical protein
MGIRNQIELVSLKNASDKLSGADRFFSNNTPLNQVRRGAGGAWFANYNVEGIDEDSTSHEIWSGSSSGGSVSGTGTLDSCNGYEWDIWARPEEKNPNTFFGDDKDSVGDNLNYNYKYETDVMRNGVFTPSKIMTVRRGDWLELKTKKSHAGYGMWIGTGSSSGHMLTCIKFGSYRCGNSFLLNNVIVKMDDGEINTTYIRVPYGAKTGFFSVLTRKGTLTMAGRRTGKLNPTFGGHERVEEDLAIPIMVAGDVSPVCVEAFQFGLSNPDNDPVQGNLESMINPHAALTQKGDSSLIGASCLNYGPTYRDGQYMRAGSYYPMGFTPAGVHHMCAFVKEMRFRVSMLANAANYNSTLTMIQYMLQMSSMTPALGLTLGPIAVGTLSVVGGMILHELGKASGGSSVIRIHRRESTWISIGGSNYRGDGAEDITQADTITNITHNMVVSSKNRGSAVSASMILDWSRMRFGCHNKLHESIAMNVSSDILNCGKEITVVDRDGDKWKTMMVCNQTHPSWPCEPGEGNQECRQADYDGYWQHNMPSTPAVHKKAVNICDDDKHPTHDGWDADGNDKWKCADGSTPKNRYTFTDNGNNWVLPHQRPDPDNPNDTEAKKRFVGGMTPLMSPPPFRCIAYESTSIVAGGYRQRPGWKDHSNFDLFRSEGLGCGGTLFWPWWWATAIGKGQLTTVSSRIYSEDMKCLSCSATAWGRDARYCMSNDNPLGYGGWTLGLKSDPSFWLGGKNLHSSTTAFTAFPNRVSSFTPYDKNNEKQLEELRGYFKQRDVDRHDQSKATAGSHYGGIPENIMLSAGAYERQPGGNCKSEVYPTEGIEAPGDGYDIKGHGYEYWDAGVIPTFAKNDVSAMDIYYGNLNKINKMRNNGRLIITERIDQITIVGKVENFTMANQRTVLVDPEHYQFSPGDIIELRMYPTTTSTTVPKQSCLVRKYKDYGNSVANENRIVDGNAEFNNGSYIKSRQGMWTMKHLTERSMKPTPQGRGGRLSADLPLGLVGKDKVHPASSVIGVAGLLMCSSTRTNTSFSSVSNHVGKENQKILRWGAAGPFDKLNQIDEKNPKPTYQAWGISLGEVIDTSMLEQHAKADISAWHKGYSVKGGLDHPAFEGSFLQNCIGATWGRNGQSAFTIVGKDMGSRTNDPQKIYLRVPFTSTKVSIDSQGGVGPSPCTSDYIWLYFQEPSGMDPTEIIQDTTLGAGRNTGSYPVVTYFVIPQICRIASAGQQYIEHATSHVQRK